MTLLHDLVAATVARFPDRRALSQKQRAVTYKDLWHQVQAASVDLRRKGLEPGDRVAVFMEKRVEAVVAIFATAMAGGVFVPINTGLKERQVAHIVNDCQVKIVVTTSDKEGLLRTMVANCQSIKQVLLVDGGSGAREAFQCVFQDWEIGAGDQGKLREATPAIDNDVAAILYTSGSTGLPKGVCLSHRNLVAGARSVNAYLHNDEHDRILTVLPISFDAGFSQLTTGLSAGAEIVLTNFSLPANVVRLCEESKITAITGVPPFWNQVAFLDWPTAATQHLRYFANTGGRLPIKTLERLRSVFKHAQPYLMYGLTEAFRSTFLDPAEVDRRPHSIGKAIPNAEILVVNQDGKICGPNEEGELVHRGAHVSLGYWGNAKATAERFRPAPSPNTRIPLPEYAVWTGDIVRKDEEGFLYFVGRHDDMIKTRGFRVSPTEIEEVAHMSGLVAEAVAIGLPNEEIGQDVAVVAVPRQDDNWLEEFAAFLRSELPGYMVPKRVIGARKLPRTSSGKIDRREVARRLLEASERAGHDDDQRLFDM